MRAPLINTTRDAGRLARWAAARAKMRATELASCMTTANTAWDYWDTCKNKTELDRICRCAFTSVLPCFRNVRLKHCYCTYVVASLGGIVAHSRHGTAATANAVKGQTGWPWHPISLPKSLEGPLLPEAPGTCHVTARASKPPNHAHPKETGTRLPTQACMPHHIRHRVCAQHYATDSRHASVYTALRAYE